MCDFIKIPSNYYYIYTLFCILIQNLLKLLKLLKVEDEVLSCNSDINLECLLSIVFIFNLWNDIYNTYFGISWLLIFVLS